MQLHDILLLRASAILPEAISAGGLTPTTDTSLFLTTYRGGSHLPADIAKSRKSPISIVENNKQWIGAADLIISERVPFLLIYCGAVILL